ncbi:YgaP family membrane protein [Pseudaquabacterium pictum]|uniref:Inner membrane protein YgaP-like transmembrane domain-containing protein n=1 Tax=Pseudaquabacterium pictum TaxID=2315236 RepID=A0A480B191_9BURK|nr:hypothetical protein AQPW35_39090 [Rubrivivax pictus]
MPATVIQVTDPRRLGAGVVPLLTGAIGFCPVYPLLGLNTCPMKKV